MPRRNRNRAARRVADRTKRNTAALEAVAAEAPPKLHRARHKTQLELLESRGAISVGQRRAGERLERDFIASGSQIGRLVASCEPPTPRGTGSRDTPGSIAARERFEAALRDAGHGLAPILVHVCVTDEPATSWAGLNGKAATDGVPVLRVALDVLVDHYHRKREQAA